MAKKRAFPLGTIIFTIDKRLSARENGGTYTETEREDELTAYLKANPSFMPAERTVARDLLKQYHKRTSPRAGSKGGIFHPARPLLLGHGLVALSGPATVPIFDMWVERKVRLNAMANEAHEAFMHDQSARRDLMLRHGQTWEQTEINFFGWDARKSDTLPPEILEDGEDGDDEAEQ